MRASCVIAPLLLGPLCTLPASAQDDPPQLRVARPSPLTVEQRAELERDRAERERILGEQGILGLEAQTLSETGKAVLCLLVAGQAGELSSQVTGDGDAADHLGEPAEALLARARGHLPTNWTGEGLDTQGDLAAAMVALEATWNRYQVETQRASGGLTDRAWFLESQVASCHRILDAMVAPQANTGENLE